VPAVTTVKRKLFTKSGVDSSCSSCHKTITSESGTGLCCDDCNNAFHENCIPKYHKEHIPISEDGYEFLSCVTKVKPSESSRPSNKNGRKKKVITMNMMITIQMNYLALQINKSKIGALVSEHYSTTNVLGYILYIYFPILLKICKWPITVTSITNNCAFV